MKSKVSVIVPVYNVEKYLEKCLESIIKQTYENLEIIIVDDGSTDNSLHICRKWDKRDPRITIIHKENEGLGFARNTGLQHASGDYILFIDSDDFISNNMVEKLYDNLKNAEADTVYCGLNRYFSDEHIIQYPPKCGKQIYLQDEVIDKVLLEMIGTIPNEKEDMNMEVSVWHSLYSMDIIRKYNVLFPSERVFMSEDISFHIDYLRYAKKVSFITDCLYFYRLNENSLSKKYDANRFDRSKKMYLQIINKLSEFIEPEKYLLRAERRLLGGARGRILDIVQFEKNNQIKLISEVSHDSTVEQILATYPYLKNPFKHCVFNFCMKYKFNAILWVLAKTVSKTVKK